MLLRAVAHKMVHAYVTSRADILRDAVSVWRDHTRALTQHEVLWAHQAKTLKLMVNILSNVEARMCQRGMLHAATEDAAIVPSRDGRPRGCKPIERRTACRSVAPTLNATRLMAHGPDWPTSMGDFI